MTLDQKIEGLLFYKASPVSIAQLQKLFEVSKEELNDSIQILRNRLMTGAIRLASTQKELQLVTAPELDELIDTVRKDELKRNIGKAGAEILAIVLYKGPISRADIDRIRGVNSSFILRNLMIRGLVDRESQENSYVFSITPTLLSYLGVTHKTEISNYSTVMDQLEKFDQEQMHPENV